MTDSGAMVIKWIVQSSWTMTGRESVDLTGGVGVDDRIGVGREDGVRHSVLDTESNDEGMRFLTPFLDEKKGVRNDNNEGRVNSQKVDDNGDPVISNPFKGEKSHINKEKYILITSNWFSYI